MIRKKINEILDRLPDEELKEVYWTIESVQKNYLYRKNLLEKGVNISEIYEEAQEIIDLWDRTFAQNIREEVKESIYYSQFKWHIFSYEKQSSLKEDEARRAFDAEPKDELYVNYQNSPIVLLYSNANNVIAADFDSQQDIYIFDKNFNWTYVHTHESMCGPYFHKIKSCK